MHLNQLYGYFGRSRNLIITEIVDKVKLSNVLLTRVIKSIIKINDNLFLVLFDSNLNYNLIKRLNLNNKNVNPIDDFKYSFKSNRKVKSNVAISAAVTAYARIEMIKYKTLEGYNIFYTDTDSLFTDKPLPQNLVGDDIGQMKDELKGRVIKRALFLGNKKYIFQYYNEKGKLITVSVFSGVKRNLLTWKEFKTMSWGRVIQVKLSNSF